MSAVEALRQGRLKEALQLLQQEVRQNPADAKHRVFLFQLLAVQGKWDKALTQLNVAGDLDGETMPMVQAYREALQCEALRQQIFAGKRSPVIFGDPEPWIAQLVDSLRLGAQGDHVGAQRMREEAFEAAPTTSGSINDEPFEWIADADSRLGPVLELLVNGRYYWVPMHRIRSIRAEAPADLRDSVWMPVSLTWANGGEAVGFIPTRYPGTIEIDDDALLLARKTEWTEKAANVYWGVGQRMLTTDKGDYPLMEIRSVQHNVTVDASVEAV